MSNNRDYVYFIRKKILTVTFQTTTSPADVAKRI